MTEEEQEKLIARLGKSIDVSMWTCAVSKVDAVALIAIIREQEATIARQAICDETRDAIAMCREKLIASLQSELTAAQERVKVLEASTKPTVADLFRRARAAREANDVTASKR